MPYQSQAQWRAMFAREARGEVPQGTAVRMAHESPPFALLPAHVGQWGGFSAPTTGPGVPNLGGGSPPPSLPPVAPPVAPAPPPGPPPVALPPSRGDKAGWIVLAFVGAAALGLALSGALGGRRGRYA